MGRRGGRRAGSVRWVCGLVGCGFWCVLVRLRRPGLIFAAQHGAVFRRCFFLFSKQGVPGPWKGRAGQHSPWDKIKKRIAQPRTLQRSCQERRSKIYDLDVEQGIVSNGILCLEFSIDGLFSRKHAVLNVVTFLSHLRLESLASMQQEPALTTTR